jgi:D-3-phosphoglycerate dehydrogenase / 2-oxoglutarate reductase
MLLRKTFLLSNGVHRGEWNKEATHSFEVRGKSLGIIGYGNIGKQLSVVAEGLGMRVIYYDVTDKVPMGNAIKKDTLQKVLKEADIVTLHVPEDETTKNLIDEKALKMMKQ